MQTVLLVVNDAPYGTEKAYNALRMALTLLREHGDEVRVRLFLLADAVFCSLPGQRTADGYYNVERMLKGVIAKGAEVKLCGGCSEARGIAEIERIPGAELATMKDLCRWVVEADKVITF